MMVDVNSRFLRYLIDSSIVEPSLGQVIVLHTHTHTRVRAFGRKFCHLSMLRKRINVWPFEQMGGRRKKPGRSTEFEFGGEGLRDQARTEGVPVWISSFYCHHPVLSFYPNDIFPENIVFLRLRSPRFVGFGN